MTQTCSNVLKATTVDWQSPQVPGRLQNALCDYEVSRGAMSWWQKEILLQGDEIKEEWTGSNPQMV